MQGNAPTAYADLSGVYGVDKSTLDSLREYEGGRLITNQYNVLPEEPNCTIPACYRAGEEQEKIFFFENHKFKIQSEFKSDAF